MHVLVTGGAGFIGGHLVQRLLDDGHRVTVADWMRSGSKKDLPAAVNLIEKDILHSGQYRNELHDIEVIFHLAAQVDVTSSVSDVDKDARINILGTIALLELAKDLPLKKFVFSSSGGAVYGDTKQIPTPETVPCEPISPYGISKWSAEQYIQLYHRLYGMPYTILRYSNVFGPGQAHSRESGVITIFCRLLQENKPLTVYGNGEQTRDYTYVGDIVDANIKAMESEKNAIYNVGTGKETSINQLIKIFEQELGRQIQTIAKPARLGELERNCLDNNKIQRELNWQPRVDLIHGIKEVFKENNITANL